MPPWRNLLPKSISDFLPGLAEEAWALKLLQSVFADLDKDGSGTLEPDEIMGELLATYAIGFQCSYPVILSIGQRSYLLLHNGRC